MNPTPLSTSFDPAFIALSFAISAIGAFAALTAAERIGAARHLSLVNLLAAGFGLGGIGIWAMHFIGMLALRVQLGIGYSMLESMVSLLVAVTGTAVALRMVVRNPGSIQHILAGGAILGAAVCVMHYLGMYGMRFGGNFQWSLPLVAASMLIAWVAATAALAILSIVRSLAARVVSSLVMATAVCAMHYTGMAAADFICTTSTPGAIPSGLGVVSALELPMLVSMLALGMAFVILVDQFFQRVAAAPSPRVARAMRTAR